MEIMEIIKDAFKYPSNNMGILVIYIVFTILASIFTIGGIFTYILGFIEPQFFLLGGLAVIVALLIGCIIYGYNISVIKSGIELTDKVPQFEWWENFNRGFDNYVVSIVYFLVPALIVALIGVIANIPGRLYAIIQEIVSQTLNVGIMGDAINPAVNMVSQEIIGLIAALAFTVLIAIILFIIFSFLQTIAEARLANTGSLSEALNIVEAAKDISRIGVGKVVALILLLIILIAIINMVLSALFTFAPILLILNVIITPYLTLVTQRAVGLLYSDIA